MFNVHCKEGIGSGYVSSNKPLAFVSADLPDGERCKNGEYKRYLHQPEPEHKKQSNTFFFIGVSFNSWNDVDRSQEACEEKCAKDDHCKAYSWCLDRSCCILYEEECNEGHFKGGQTSFNKFYVPPKPVDDNEDLGDDDQLLSDTHGDWVTVMHCFAFILITFFQF